MTYIRVIDDTASAIEA